MLDARGIKIPADVTHPKLKRELDKLIFKLAQVSVAVGSAVEPGNNPGPAFDSGPFFYLPGRPAGQTGYGGSLAGGDLTLGSTANSSKGNIFFGIARTSTYDETNNRWGMKTATPLATLHVKGEAPVTSVTRPTSTDPSGSGWLTAGAGSFGTAHQNVNEVVSDGDNAYITTNSPAANAHVELKFASFTPSGTSGWILHILARKTVAGTVGLAYQLLDNGIAGTIVKQDTTGASTPLSGSSFASPYVDLAIALSAAEAALIVTPSNLYLRLGNNTSGWNTYSPNDLTVTQVYLEYPTSGGSGGGGKTAIFQAVASQAETLSEWQNSSSTALVDITAAGRLTVESGGSFRHVPGAAASTLFLGNSTGDASWGTVALLSAYHSDALAASVVLGDLIHGNATPKWARLAGNTTTTKKFLTQTGNGTISAVPVWDTIASGDLPAISSAAGWTDDGTVVRLTTSTDQVGIGTTTPGASLGLVNVNATTDVIFSITGKASQTGDALQIRNSTPTVKIAARVTSSETGLDLTPPTGGRTVLRLIPGSSGELSYIDWGVTGDFGPALGVTGAVPCPGTRLNTFGNSGVAASCDGYGQDIDDAWVLVDNATNYTIWTADTTSASRRRARWSPNGDLENYGRIRASKFTVGTTGLSASTPELRLEETGAGTDYMAFRAGSTITTSHTYVWPNAVASGLWNVAASGATGTISYLTATRGALLVGNSTPAWNVLAVGSANTLLRSDGTDATWGTIDHNYISNRTRRLFIPGELFIQANGTAMSFSVLGTYPNVYRALQFVDAPATSPQGVLTIFRVPKDWASGTLEVKILYKMSAVGFGANTTILINTKVLAYSAGSSPTAAATSTGTSIAHPGEYTNTHEESLGTITVSADQFVRLVIDRDSTLDDTTDTFQMFGVSIEYTADM